MNQSLVATMVAALCWSCSTTPSTGQSSAGTGPSGGSPQVGGAESGGSSSEVAPGGSPGGGGSASAGVAGAAGGVAGAAGGVAGAAGSAGIEPLTLRVLTFNIKTGSLSSLETIADIVTASRADIVGLQEVDKGTNRSNGVDQPARLAELTGMQAFFAPGLHDYDGGQYGVATLVAAELRVLIATPHDLDQPAAGEARAALELAVARPENDSMTPDFVFLNTHWDLVDENRVAQAEHVGRIGMAHPAGTPLLLVGDLNARAGSEPIDTLLGYWTAAAESVFGIDWIVHRSERWQPSDVRELTSDDHPEATTASDHVPVLATYGLTTK
jgi:endonuclease/exonuclease/phosphatase family metal-dependent hydrolase